MSLLSIRHSLIWVALALSIGALLFNAGALLSVHSDNALIEQLVAGKDVDVSKVISGKPELRLARALYLKQKHRYDEALSTLSLIMEQGDQVFRAKVRYNLGNLYLEQAMNHVETMKMNEALPLVDLAKQAYRQALALNSQDWDSKYNLEVAMRLLPEMDRINSGNEDDPKKQATQLWTTVPGFPRGLP